MDVMGVAMSVSLVGSVDTQRSAMQRTLAPRPPALVAPVAVPRRRRRRGAPIAPAARDVRDAAEGGGGGGGARHDGGGDRVVGGAAVAGAAHAAGPQVVVVRRVGVVAGGGVRAAGGGEVGGEGAGAEDLKIEGRWCAGSVICPVAAAGRRDRPHPKSVRPSVRPSYLRARGLAGEAEVDQLHVAPGRDEQVLGLHVAVHDAVRVEELEGQHGLGHEVAGGGCVWVWGGVGG